MSAPKAPGRFDALSDARPIWKLLAVFLVPLMLSNVLQSLSGTMSNIFIGRLAGVQALAAVSSIFPVLFFLISFLIGLASGSTVLIGQAYGARDHDRVKAVAGTTLALTVLLGIVVGAFGTIFTRELLGAMGTPADILEIAVGYSRILFAGMPLLFVWIIYTTFLRGTGDTHTPFIALIASTALTIALTPALMLGWAGLPRLGVNGAAVGTYAATAIALAGLLVHLARSGNPLALDREILANMTLRAPIVLAIVRIGIPTGLNLVMVSLSEIAVISFVNRFGSSATAAYGAVNQVVSYVQFPAISIGIAASIFGSQAIGAGRLDRLRRIVRAGVAMNYVVEGVLIVLVYVFNRAIVGLFITSPETADVAHRLLAITLWSYAIFGNARVLSGMMLASGTVVWPTVISIFSIWGVEVPVAWYLSQRIGLDGVWYGYPAAFVASLALQYGYYALVWKKRRIERL